MIYDIFCGAVISACVLAVGMSIVLASYLFIYLSIYLSIDLKGSLVKWSMMETCLLCTALAKPMSGKAAVSQSGVQEIDG